MGDLTEIKQEFMLCDWCKDSDCHIQISWLEAQIILELLHDYGAKLLYNEKNGLYFSREGECESFSIDDIIDLVSEINYGMVEDTKIQRRQYSGFLFNEVSKKTLRKHQSYQIVLDELLDKTLFGKKAAEVLAQNDDIEVMNIDDETISKGKAGELPYHTLIKKEIDYTIVDSVSYEAFLKGMQYRGFEHKYAYPLAFRPKGARLFYRTGRIGEEYTEDSIRRRIRKIIAERPYMIKPEKVEKIEDGDNIAIFTIKVLNVEEALLMRGKSCDWHRTDNYFGNNFFIRVIHYKFDDSYSIVKGKENSHLFYVNDHGDTHWVDHMLSENETLIMNKLCRNVLSKLDVKEQRRSMEIEEKRL